MADAALMLPPSMSVAEFIDWPGDGTPTRYELVDGVPRAMAPASDAHGTIMINVAAIIWGKLRTSRPNCRVVGAPGIQPHLRADWNFRIPDLGVTCAANEKGAVMMPTPVLLVEVLLPGNAADTWDNVRNYATIPSVLEILILHQSVIKAEILRRDGAGAWPSNPALVEAAGTVQLASIGVDFPLRDAYAGTHLDAA